MYDNGDGTKKSFNSTDMAFIDGDIIVKVENTKEARYLIGIALIAGKNTEFTEPWGYDCYPYFVIEKDELVAYIELPNMKHLTLTTYKDLLHSDEYDPIKRQIEEVWSPTLPVSKQHLADSISVISYNNISVGLFQAGYPSII